MSVLRYALPIMMVVVLAGCGRNEPSTNEPKDSVKDLSAKDSIADAIPVVKGDADSTEYSMQNDTQENLDAGLFARKEQTIYNPDLLCGTWVCGTLHEVYNSDGTGLQWDTKDDVSREEAQPFMWQMENNNLRQVYSMQLGGVVPRTYKVTFVDDESLVYKDDFGTSYMWDKGD